MFPNFTCHKAIDLKIHWIFCKSHCILEALERIGYSGLKSTLWALTNVLWVGTSTYQPIGQWFDHCTIEAGSDQYTKICYLGQ